MMSLLERIFMKKPELSYVFAEYQPILHQYVASQTDLHDTLAANDIDDDMQIDRMFQSV